MVIILRLIHKNNILNNAELILKYNNNKFPRYVLNQLNIFVPVGNDINIVIPVKYALVSVSKPIVYIWCPHTILPRREIQLNEILKLR